MPTILKLALASLVLIGVVSPSANANPPSEQCRQINNRKERHDCYARQDAARASPKPKAAPTKTDSDLDRLKRENDLMGQKLRSIFKGC